MATKSELEAKIERYNKTIKGGAVSGAVLEGVKKKLSEAQAELEGLEKKPEPKAGDKAELEAKIERYNKTIKGGAVSGAVLEGVKVKLKKAKEELEALGGAKATPTTAPAKEKTEPKPVKAGKGRPTGVKNKKEPKAKPIVDKQARTVTVDGVVYSKDKCDELYAAWDAVIERGRKAGKKFAKKSSGEVIGDKLVSTGEKVLSSINKTDVEKKPTFYRDKLERLSKVMIELADLIDDLVGKDDASDEVKGLVKQIQAFITKNLSKK